MSGTGGKAKDAAVSEAVSVAVYFGIVGAVSLVILKRYYLIGVWRKLTERRMSPADARVEREVAEFRRELASLPGPDQRPRGLYER